MRKLFLVLISICLLNIFSCDDGDVITFELDFEETFKACSGVNSLIFYKTKNDPSESLSLKVVGLTLDQILVVDKTTKTYEKSITLSNDNPFNYRTYSNTELPASGLFCSDVPLSDIIITQDIESTDGTALLKTVLTEDDNDGVPAELEDFDGNGNLEDDDKDSDGIPNYIDADDDGDNILTRDENPDPNGDGDLSDAQDTDGDGTPDYLDDDDDGDDVLTRNEENDSQDENPANDMTYIDPITGKGIPDYLNGDIATTVTATAYREHIITQTYTVTLTITDFDLTLISLDQFNFGILQDSNLSKTRKGATVFN